MDFIDALCELRKSLLNRHRVKEALLYKYVPFNVFIKMCKEAEKKIIQKLEESMTLNKPIENFGYLDLFCFDAETYNDPREGKILIELSEENECTNGDIGLVAQLYRDTEINKNLVDINTMVFVGSFVFEMKKSSQNNFLSYSLGDSLPMWRDYANKGKGVCLEIKVDSKFKFPLYKVSYNKEEQLKTLWEISRILASIPERYRKEHAALIREIIDPIRFLYKSKEHEYENEARIIEVLGFDKKSRLCDLENNSHKQEQNKYQINLLEVSEDSSLSRLYIVLENFFFKNGGAVIVGPAFEESDYIFGKRVVIKQIYYWLKKLNLLDKVEVRVSRYNIRF